MTQIEYNLPNLTVHKKHMDAYCDIMASLAGLEHNDFIIS